MKDPLTNLPDTEEMIANLDRYIEWADNKVMENSDDTYKLSAYLVFKHKALEFQNLLKHTKLFRE